MSDVPSTSVARLVRGVARRSPDQPAVAAANHALTYGELDERAEELAARLTARGVGAETPVAVRLPRSAEHIVATLAIWKAGGACVPVDPALPAGRAAALLAVARVALEVTEDGRIEHVADSPVPAGGGGELGWAPPPGEGDRIAYVFFTSGSTGVPKAVAVPHLGIVNEAGWTGSAFGIGPGQRGSWLSSPGFAISRWEVWSSLANGACVAVAPPGTEWDPVAVRDWLTAANVTWSIVVTGMGERLFGLDWPGHGRLRLLVTGGEQLRIWPDGLPFEVVNSYGVTEASSVRLVSRLGRASADGRPPPMGHPIANTTVHVLDEKRDPVAAGVVGELYLGGLGYARGYVADPARTAACFVADPSTMEGRLYRTGDLVRQDPDGAVHYVGRAGDDLKVRGVRVNPAEVEAVLMAHPAVGSAAVAIRSDRPDGTQIVAYVVPRPGVDLVQMNTVRAHLAAQLPHQLVPTAFVQMADLPTLPSGKVDRVRLPRPDAEVCGMGGPTPPRDEVETMVLTVLQQVLERDVLGVDDDFFANGGDSLAVARVADELAKLTGLTPSVEALFEARTAASIAELIRRLRARAVEHASSAEAGSGWADELTADEMADLLAVLEREG
ncbi:MAG TPA: non-ribosomal peptide synthetase [Actinoplanes sp.]|nr:non-ribosomal peptide synthetase [Actinoplanes sp.]